MSLTKREAMEHLLAGGKIDICQGDGTLVRHGPLSWDESKGIVDTDGDAGDLVWHRLVIHQPNTSPEMDETIYWRRQWVITSKGTLINCPNFNRSQKEQEERYPTADPNKLGPWQSGTLKQILNGEIVTHDEQYK